MHLCTLIPAKCRSSQAWPSRDRARPAGSSAQACGPWIPPGGWGLRRETGGWRDGLSLLSQPPIHGAGGRVRPLRVTEAAAPPPSSLLCPPSTRSTPNGSAETLLFRPLCPVSVLGPQQITTNQVTWNDRNLSSHCLEAPGPESRCHRAALPRGSGEGPSCVSSPRRLRPAGSHLRRQVLPCLPPADPQPCPFHLSRLPLRHSSQSLVMVFRAHPESPGWSPLSRPFT